MAMQIELLASGRYYQTCRSGYVLDSTGRECRRMCARHMLMCADCLAAEPVQDAVQAIRAGLLDRMRATGYTVAVLVKDAVQSFIDAAGIQIGVAAC